MSWASRTSGSASATGRARSRRSSPRAAVRGARRRRCRERVAHGGFDRVGRAVPLDDGLAGRHRHDGVGEVVTTGLAHRAKPAQIRSPSAPRPLNRCEQTTLNWWSELSRCKSFQTRALGQTVLSQISPGFDGVSVHQLSTKTPEPIGAPRVPLAPLRIDMEREQRTGREAASAPTGESDSAPSDCVARRARVWKSDRKGRWRQVAAAPFRDTPAGPPADGRLVRRRGGGANERMGTARARGGSDRFGSAITHADRGTCPSSIPSPYDSRSSWRSPGVALLWQMRFFRSRKDTTRRTRREQLPDPRLPAWARARPWARPCFGSLWWAMADEGPKWAALASGCLASRSPRSCCACFHRLAKDAMDERARS
jgi:hypothetical protein